MRSWNGMTNREYLVEHQYRNAGNLEARIRFYERFSVNTRVGVRSVAASGRRSRP